MKRSRTMLGLLLLLFLASAAWASWDEPTEGEYFLGTVIGLLALLAFVGLGAYQVALTGRLRRRLGEERKRFDDNLARGDIGAATAQVSRLSRHH